MYQALQENVSRNLSLTEVIENYEKEILKYKAQVAQISILEQSIQSVDSEQSSFNNTPMSIQDNEVSYISLYDDIQELIHSKEEEILNLNSKLHIQSSQLLTLKQQLEEASNQLSLKDQQLASSSKQIQDLQKSLKSLTKTPAPRYSLNDLYLLDTQSDQKLNEYRRRSSDMHSSSIDSYITPLPCKVYSKRLTESFNSKETRLDGTPFCIESGMKRTPLAPIMSANCSTEFDSEVKKEEISTVKERTYRYWDSFDSVQKCNN